MSDNPGKHGPDPDRPVDHTPPGGSERESDTPGDDQLSDGEPSWGQEALRATAAPSTHRPVGPRPIRGPRFSGGPLLLGLGLLSMLVVIGIMALLVVKVVDGTRSTGLDDVPGAIVADGGAGGAGPDSGSGDSTAAQTVPGALDSATASACRMDKQTIETAVSVYEAMTGDLPLTIDDLIGESLLREDPGGFELEQGPDGVTVVGVGRCEGTD